MKKRWFVNLLFVLSTTAVSPASLAADVVWVTGNSQPIYGKITSETPQQIQIKVFSNGSYSTTQTIAAAEIETKVVNIDEKRLESLSPDSPKLYRRYAEELSSQIADPSALELAKQLYILAAANSQGEERYGAMLGLASLAQTPKQRQRYEMLLRLNSPDPNTESSEAKSAMAQSAFTSKENMLMQSVVLALRQERSMEANKILKSKENQASLKKWSDHITLKELEQIAGQDRPTKVQLSKLLDVEILIRQSGTAGSAQKTTAQDWADLATQPAQTLAVLPTLRNVTAFDPAKSIYRNGSWRAPAKR